MCLGSDTVSHLHSMLRNVIGSVGIGLKGSNREMQQDGQSLVAIELPIENRHFS